MEKRHAIFRIFAPDYARYEGVRPINVYLLRLVFTLTFLFVGIGSWTVILKHDGEWKALDAVAWCVWAAYSTLSALGIWKPLKMLPILAFQIFYKVIWLIIVAYPLSVSGELIGSEYERMTNDFLWVGLPIVAMPWGYFFRSFLRTNALTSQATT